MTLKKTLVKAAGISIINNKWKTIIQNSLYLTETNQKEVDDNNQQSKFKNIIVNLQFQNASRTFDSDPSHRICTYTAKNTS